MAVRGAPTELRVGEHDWTAFDQAVENLERRHETHRRRSEDIAAEARALQPEGGHQLVRWRRDRAAPERARLAVARRRVATRSRIFGQQKRRAGREVRGLRRRLWLRRQLAALAAAARRVGRSLLATLGGVLGFLLRLLAGTLGFLLSLPGRLLGSLRRRDSGHGRRNP